MFATTEVKKSKSRHRLAAAMLITSLVLLVAGMAWYCLPIDGRFDRVVAGLDRQNVGRGPDPYQKDVVEHSEAYSILATVFVRLGDAMAAKAAADWLMHDAVKGDRRGWGLPFSWDAFGDGTVNSKDTVYGVSVALGVRALIDICEFASEEKYCARAVEALEYYKQFFTRVDDGGYFWYSDRAHDAFDVNNVNALLMAQYARASFLFKRADYAAFAEQAFSHIWSNRKESDAGVWWSYGQNQLTPNDLVHAVMMVQGLVEFAYYAKRQLRTDGMVRYLEAFIERDGVREFGPHADLPSVLLDRPARVWGVAALIGAMAKENKPLTVQKLMVALDAYEFLPGSYGLTPGESIPAPILKAYVALGLLETLQDGCIPCRLMRLGR